MFKKKILIVDDDPKNIFALSANLKAKGFECLSCPDATEAIQLLQTSELVDVVLMDMMMPGMDGYEAIPVIKTIEKRKLLPIFAVTAQAMTGDREKCLLAGASEYISKPIDLDRLLDALAKYNITA